MSLNWPASRRDLRFHQPLVRVVRDGEAAVLADDLHVAVADIDAGDNARQFLVAADRHQAAEQPGALVSFTVSGSFAGERRGSQRDLSEDIGSMREAHAQY